MPAPWMGQIFWAVLGRIHRDFPSIVLGKVRVHPKVSWLDLRLGDFEMTVVAREDDPGISISIKEGTRGAMATWDPVRGIWGPFVEERHKAMWPEWATQALEAAEHMYRHLWSTGPLYHELFPEEAQAKEASQ